MGPTHVSYINDPSDKSAVCHMTKMPHNLLSISLFPVFEKFLPELLIDWFLVSNDVLSTEGLIQRKDFVGKKSGAENVSAEVM